MKGTYVYCEDEALRNHLKSLIENNYPQMWKINNKL